MLLKPANFALVQSSEKVLRRLSGELSVHACPETHAAIIELMTGPTRRAGTRAAYDGPKRSVRRYLAENRFLAGRDGLEARLIDPLKHRLVPARALLDLLLARCGAYADPVGSVELDRVKRLAARNGAERQRRWARDGGLLELMSTLTERFAADGGRSLRGRVPTIGSTKERCFDRA